MGARGRLNSHPTWAADLFLEAGSGFWIRIRVNRWIRIHIKVNIQKPYRLKIEPKTLTVKAWRLKMETWRVYKPVVAVSYHYDEDQDPEGSAFSEKLDPGLDPH